MLESGVPSDRWSIEPWTAAKTAKDPHALLATFPGIRLSGEPLVWRHTGPFRGLAALPVRLG